MDAILLDRVSKVFHHHAALFNWVGRERSGATQALNQLALSLPQGSILVLLGPNGGGKTTTLKLIATMLLPDSGRVLVEGEDAAQYPQRVRRKVGFAVATERSFFPRLTARENLDFFAALEDVPRRRRPARVQDLLVAAGMADFADTLVMKFSSGLYQRLGIARALIKHPSILLLDEPSRSLDPAARCHLWDMLRTLHSQGTTLVVATHDFDEAVALGNAVAVLDSGNLVAFREVRDHTTAEELRAFYFTITPESAPATPALEARR